MHLESIAAFALAMFVLAASPGPGVFAVTARSMTAGFPRACAMIAGMVLGDLLFLLAAVFGLAALAQTLNWLFTLVKYAGAAYLVYLGLRFIFSRPAPAADGAPRSAPRHSARTRDGFAASFASGLAVTLGNPKVIVFYLGLLPTFMNLEAMTGADVIAACGVVASVLGSVLAVYAWLADRAGRMFTNRAAVTRMNRAAGAVMVATGATLAAKA